MNQLMQAVHATDFTNNPLKELSLLDRLYDKGFVPSDRWMEFLMDFITSPKQYKISRLILISPPRCAELLNRCLSHIHSSAIRQNLN